MNPIIEHLKLERAPSDAARAHVLAALVRYGKAVGDTELAAAAEAHMPKAHPYQPPQEWIAQYREGFELAEDEDRGVCYDTDGDRYCWEYWTGLTDEERHRRLASPRIGFADGQKDAQALNDA